MKPRRTKSKKWTNLPQDYCKQVIQGLSSSFADETKSGKFIVEGRIYPDELILRMGYLEKGRLRQNNFEISIDYKTPKDSVAKLLGVGVDVGASLLNEIFSSTDDSEFPRIWATYEVEKTTVHVQYSGTNSELDGQANALLGDDFDSLMQDDSTSLGGIKKDLGLPDDEQEDS